MPSNPSGATVAVDSARDTSSRSTFTGKEPIVLDAVGEAGYKRSGRRLSLTFKGGKDIEVSMEEHSLTFIRSEATEQSDMCTIFKASLLVSRSATRRINSPLHNSWAAHITNSPPPSRPCSNIKRTISERLWLRQLQTIMMMMLLLAESRGGRRASGVGA